MESVLKEENIKRKHDVFLKRIALIDLLRGICMVLVIFDHIMWNFAYFFPKWANFLNDSSSLLFHIGDFANDYWYWPLRLAVRFFALGMFVLLSGISVAFSKDNYQRAVKMIAFTVGISLVTNIVNGFWPMGCNINFNVIAVISFCVLIYCFISQNTYRSSIAMLLVLFVFEYSILPILYNYLENAPALLLPFWEPDITINGRFYYHADYMPFFPYCLFFFIGVIISIIYYFPRIKNKQLGNHYNWQRPFCFLGRHSLIIYLAHQIVFQGIFMAIGIAAGLPV